MRTKPSIYTVRAAEEVPHLSNSWDVRRTIEEAGGVPLDEDRQIDVRYVAKTKRNRMAAKSLATDASYIFAKVATKKVTSC
ncbi:MAG: hypothetical protein R3C05_11990 [Pirellulaceae bacterium]